MSSEQIAADYIREHRADESDGTIRAALYKQGFSSDQLDEAFRLSGPRPETPRPAPPARPPEELRFRVWFFAVGAAMFLLLLLAVPGLLWLQNPRAALPPELQDYKAVGDPEPGHLARFLPAGLKDEDATADYKEIAVSGLASVAPDSKLPPPTPAQLAALDRALTKSRCALTVALARPGTDAWLASLAARTRLYLVYGKLLQERMQEAQGRGDWAGAEAAARRLVLFGWHAAQEPDPSAQAFGAMWLLRGMRGARDSITAGGTADAELPFDVERAALDLDAYAADPAEANRIQKSAADPAELAGLRPRLDDAVFRRRYGWVLLLAAATNWSQAEVALGRLDPRRTAFFAEAASSEQPELKALAACAAAMARDAERSLTDVSAGGRDAAFKEFAARAGQGVEPAAP